MEFKKLMYSISSRPYMVWLTKLSKCKLFQLPISAKPYCVTIDKKHILIGECKWTHDDDADRLMETLANKVRYLPFIKKGQQVHLALFLKESPVHIRQNIKIVLPEEIMKV